MILPIIVILFVYLEVFIEAGVVLCCDAGCDCSFSSSAASWGDVRINGPTLSTTGCPSSGCALHPMFQFLPLSADRK